MLQASLKVIGGKNDGKVIEFKSRKFLVGREQDCHLRPNSDLVSRHHCVFTLDDYTLRLRDLGSTNGTLVNGRRIRGETVLMTGDVVRIGKLDLEVVIGKAAGTNALAPLPHIETTTNASAMDTQFALPDQTTLEDSGMSAASPSSETVDFEAPIVPSEDMGSDDAVPVESETIAASAAADTTIAEIPAQQPAYPQQPVPGYAPEQMPPAAWQYPPGYGQYPQYQQYLPPGYPMAYPPGYPPGYGYPPQQPAPYPAGGYQQPGANPPASGKPSGPGAENRLPEIRLPNPEDTGAKDVPKPAPVQAQPSAPSTSTPSKSAEELLNSSRRRRREEDQ
jgi:pSer/pThr/pTyr-binding forkhead associated (FHA) protein